MSEQLGLPSIDPAVKRCSGCGIIKPWRMFYMRKRGWLCQMCNAGLGALGDNPVLLERAASYMRERGHAQSRPVFS